MKAVPKPIQTFFKWVCRVFGVLILLQLALSLIGMILFFGFGVATHRINKTNLLHILQHNIVAIGFGWFLMAAFGLWLVQMGWRKEKEAAQPDTPSRASGPEQTAVPAEPSSSLAIPAKTRNKRWSSCNILHSVGDTNRLWQFDAKGKSFVLKREHSGAPGQPLPSNVAAKSWRSLFQPKLNVAWLPPENVFLRVIELPKSNFEETLSMVELQLEKLSPLPVAQIVWMIHPLPQTAGDLQTIIVVIAARHAVEEFLGKLEGQGYLADRLEAPVLDELAATPATEDGAWIYPTAFGSQKIALVAWWSGSRLRNLSFVVLPPDGDQAKSLKDQLAQLTWAGELEGWLTAAPAWHLVAEGDTATEWGNVLQTSLGEPIPMTQPLPVAELAAHTARRMTQASMGATLLPGEFSTRYHQQFVDRLWLHGLMAAGVLYIVYVAIYFCATDVLQYRVHQVEQQVAVLNGSYTNTLQLKARYRVLRERQDLKYAALDCWKIVAEELPSGISLQRMSFANGQTLSLNGVVTRDQLNQIIGPFYDGVRQAKVNGELMFDQSDNEVPVYQQRGNEVSWRLSLPLAHHQKEPQ